MKLPKEIWMCENEQARWFEFEQPYDLPNDVTVIKMVPQRTWVGLTDEERKDIELGIEVFDMSVEDILKEAEAKLKERNT